MISTITTCSYRISCLCLEYFRCPYAGTFADPHNCAQGSYFLCDYSSKNNNNNNNKILFY